MNGTPSPVEEGDSVPHEAYLGALAGLDGVGPATLRRLLTGRDPRRAWDMVRSGRVPPEVVEGMPSLTRRAAKTWVDVAGQIDPLRSWQEWRRAGIGVMSLGQPGYPSCLVDDLDPPVVLFHRGDPDVLVAPRVAIIGTRRATGYGRRVAHELGRSLTARGVCVVSGLALGIDAAAHRGAVAALESPLPDGVPAHRAAGPAAVVGGGVDAPGPVTNAELARSVVETGVVLSEVPPGTVPAPWRFPVRNRILAGLAEVVVVVESAERGGSMSTVDEAERRGRTVLAVPGPVDSPSSAGTNRLIADGAGLCSGVEDVLLALGWASPSTPQRTGATADPRPYPVGDAAAVLDALGFSPVPIETLSRELGLGLGPLSVALGELEAMGWAERNGPFVERVAGSVHGSVGQGS